MSSKFPNFDLKSLPPTGLGSLSGPIGYPTNNPSPASWRVDVVASTDGIPTLRAGLQLAGWLWGSSSDWKIGHLDVSRKYHAIAYDITGQYDPVVKMNLVPTVD